MNVLKVRRCILAFQAVPLPDGRVREPQVITETIGIFTRCPIAACSYCLVLCVKHRRCSTLRQVRPNSNAPHWISHLSELFRLLKTAIVDS